MKIINAVIAGVLALALGNAHAALFDRGGGLLYDDVLNVTWVSDANILTTLGYTDPGGGGFNFTWRKAMEVVGGLDYAGYSDWRLPSAYLNKGWTDWGCPSLGLICEADELAYMYRINIGAFNEPVSGTVSFGSFEITNIMGPYWTSTPSPNRGNAIYFNFGSGFNSFAPNNCEFPHACTLNYVWILRDGDVAATIPEPATIALLGVALAGLGATRRRKTVNQA